ncbi:MAG: hypothetical protein KDC61_23090 [Saprospiraceae bacterium]|nr:hypothetical protein [Saprospiraceae bacterium]MCB0577465.1 hypothetical protein [Saprospiraceae bacterium]MCB9356726.1 hypothetical protein [Lewinellaceae bacterium]
MKAVYFSLLFIGLILSLVSCDKKVQRPPEDLTALQQKLDADPDVAYARQTFHEHCLIVASFSPEQLSNIYAKAQSCGFYPSEVPIPKLQDCLAGIENAERFVTGEKLLRSFQELKKSIEQKYPEYARLERKQRSSMLFPVNEAHATEMRSVFSNRKK